MKIRILTLIFLLLPLCLQAEVSEQNLALIDSIRTLSDQLEHHQAQRKAANKLLLSERRRLSPGIERINVCEQIASYYINEHPDTAVMYLRLALGDAKKIGREELADIYKMRIFATMPKLGATKEAIELFQALDPSKMNEELRRIYWRSGAELYSSVYKEYPEGEFKEDYKLKAIRCLDSLATYYPADSPLRTYTTAASHLLRGENSLATANFLEVLPQLNERPQLFDFAISIASNYYYNKPEYRQLYLSLVLQRAITALKNGYIAPAASASLGKELIDEGYKDLGRKFLALALESPEYYHAGEERITDRSSYAILLHNASVQSRYVLSATIVISLIIIIALTIVIFALRRRLHGEKLLNQEQIAATERIAESATRANNHLTAMAFLAIEQLHEFNVLVARKLKAHQTAELNSDIESGKTTHQQLEKYFKVFDHSFLSNFPDFIDKLNALLQPDKQLALLPDDRLSPELRIAAFMRLGISDSQNLARAMGLSLNTIYTYRNRLRSRALNREEFESQVRSIL